MDANISPISISLQPGQHLSVDSRPGTAATLNQDQTRFSSSELTTLWQEDFPNLMQVSHYVTTPFKHGQKRRYQDTRTAYDVGSPLKNNILHSVASHKKNVIKESTEDIVSMQRHQTFHSKKRQGRLLPLLGSPAVKGPVIKQCIGITSPGRSITNQKQSHSSICFHNSPGSRKHHKRSLARWQVSIHRTSLTSNVSESHGSSRSKIENGKSPVGY